MYEKFNDAFMFREKHTLLDSLHRAKATVTRFQSSEEVLNLKKIPQMPVEDLMRMYTGGQETERFIMSPKLVKSPGGEAHKVFESEYREGLINQFPQSYVQLTVLQAMSDYNISAKSLNVVNKNLIGGRETVTKCENANRKSLTEGSKTHSESLFSDTGIVMERLRLMKNDQSPENVKLTKTNKTIEDNNFRHLNRPSTMNHENLISTPLCCCNHSQIRSSYLVQKLSRYSLGRACTRRNSSHDADQSNKTCYKKVQPAKYCKKYLCGVKLHAKEIFEDSDFTLESGSSSKHTCATCGKRFKRPSSLATHQYIHTGVRPYICPFKDCGKRFNVRSNKERHYKLHLKNENIDLVLISEDSERWAPCKQLRSVKKSSPSN